MNKDSGASIGRLLERSVRSGLAPGLVAAWGRPDEGLDTRAAGAASLVPAYSEMDQSVWFDLASLTKPLVTTTLCLLAFRSRMITLETTVGEILTETRGAAIADVDVLELLTHTSGLPSWLPLYSLAKGNDSILLNVLRDVRLVAKPGTCVIYSCLGFIVLGRMIERVSDSSLDHLFMTSVVQQLGLANHMKLAPLDGNQRLAGSALKAEAEEILTRQAGYDPQWIPTIRPGFPDDGNARFLQGAAGNAGLFGTASGVGTLAAEYLPEGGNLLTAEEASLSFSDYTPCLQQSRGLGWQLASSPGCSAGPGLSRYAFGHTGFTGVSLWIEPEVSEVYILLSNRNHPNHRGIDLHPLRRRFHELARTPSSRISTRTTKR